MVQAPALPNPSFPRPLLPIHQVVQSRHRLQRKVSPATQPLSIGLAAVEHITSNTRRPQKQVGLLKQIITIVIVSISQVLSLALHTKPVCRVFAKKANSAIGSVWTFPLYVCPRIISPSLKTLMASHPEFRCAGTTRKAPRPTTVTNGTIMKLATMGNVFVSIRITTVMA